MMMMMILASRNDQHSPCKLRLRNYAFFSNNLYVHIFKIPNASRNHQYNLHILKILIIDTQIVKYTRCSRNRSRKKFSF